MLKVMPWSVCPNEEGLVSSQLLDIFGWSSFKFQMFDLASKLYSYNIVIVHRLTNSIQSCFYSLNKYKFI